MAYLYKFSERYKEKLNEVEQAISVEEKEYFRHLLEYDEKVFVKILGEEKYQQTIKEVEEMIVCEKKKGEENKEKIEGYKKNIEDYRKNEIYNYIRKILYRYLEKEDFSYSEDREAEVEKDLLYFVLHDKWMKKAHESKDAHTDHQNINRILDILDSAPKDEYNRQIWSMRKQIYITHQGNNSCCRQRNQCIILGSEYDDIELLEREVLGEIVGSWIMCAEREGKSSTIREKEILLCKTGDIKKIQDSFLKKLKEQHSNCNSHNVIEAYFEFLCKKVFPEICFWKVVFGKEERNQRCRDYMLARKIEGIMGVYEGGIWTRKETLKIKQAIYMSEAEGINVYWFCPKKAENVFRDTFLRYGFRRCFCTFYEKYFVKNKEKSENESMQEFLAIQADYTWRERKKVNLEMEIHNSFLRWTSLYYLDEFYLSSVKDVLFCVLNGTTIPKKNCEQVWYEEGHGYSLRNSPRVNETFIWCMHKPDNREIGKVYQLKKYFSREYQIIENKKGTKEKQPKKLMDRALEENSEVDYFESYMLETQNAIFTAWRLYSIVYELISFEKDDTDLNLSIANLARNIGNIHNLELRLHVLDTIEMVIHVIMNDRHMGLVKSLNQVVEAVGKETQEFNEKYDQLILGLIWLFKEKKEWDEIMWLRNAENTKFSQLLSEIKDLMDTDNKDKSYCQEKFVSVYKLQTVAKGRQYSIYEKIRSELKASGSPDKKWLKNN